MKRIKVVALTLALGLAGVVYAAGGNAQSTTQACDMKTAQASCCASGASCCTGGSCCAAKVAKH